MTKVLVNLLMNEETQALMDSFSLRNGSSVDLPAVVERFIVKFMADYEARIELARMQREGVMLEPLPQDQTSIQPSQSRSIKTAQGPGTQFPMVHSLPTPTERPQTPTEQERAGIATPPPSSRTPQERGKPNGKTNTSKAGVATPLMSHPKVSPAAAVGLTGRLDQGRGFVKNAEGTTAALEPYPNRVHVWQRGETLSQIAIDFGTTWTKLYELNREVIDQKWNLDRNDARGENMVGIELILPAEQ